MRVLKILIVFHMMIMMPLAFADEVIQPGSNAHHNVLQTRDFLVQAGFAQEAAWIDALLQNQKLYSMDKIDFWGDPVSESGLAKAGSKKVYIREDHLHHGTRLSLNGSSNDFRSLMNLMFILIHEAIHIKDFHSFPTSSEKLTYERSFITYHSILWNYLLPTYEKRSNLGDPRAKDWKDRISAYSAQLHEELATYDSQEYGVINRTFAPLVPHTGNCVAWMKHRPLADYVLNLGMFFGRHQSYKEGWSEFNRWAQYSHPIPNNQKCLAQANITSPVLLSTPVGYYGPRVRQFMYVIDRVPEGSWVKITKTDQATRKANIKMDILTHTGNPSSFPRQLKVKGSVYDHQPENQIFFKSFDANVVIVVHENVESAFPKSIQFRVTRLFKDENDNWVEGPLAYRQLDFKQQKLYGYHTINRDVQNGSFTQKSPYHFEKKNMLTDTLKVDLKAGDFIRMRVPKFDYRSTSILKLLPEDPTKKARELKAVHTHYNWKEVTDHRIKEDGTYYVITKRGHSFFDNRGFQVGFEFSRNGAVGPEKIKIERPSVQELAQVGIHLPKSSRVTFAIDSKKNAVGDFVYDTPFFRAFTMMDLNTKEGDYLNFKTLPTTNDKVTVYIAEEVETNKLKTHKIFYSFHPSGGYVVRSNNPHYMITVQDNEFAEKKSYQFNLDHIRQDRKGPFDVKYRFFAPQEMQRFGYFPRTLNTFKGHKLVEAHPKGFILTEDRYRHYRFKLEKPTKVRLHRTKDAHHKVRFILSKLNWELYNADQKALEEIRRTHYWHKEMTVNLKPGYYFITLESPLKRNDSGGVEDTDVSWNLFFSSKGGDPTQIKVKALDISNSKDDRFRLVPKN